MYCHLTLRGHGSSVVYSFLKGFTLSLLLKNQTDYSHTHRHLHAHAEVEECPGGNPVHVDITHLRKHTQIERERDRHRERETHISRTVALLSI